MASLRPSTASTTSAIDQIKQSKLQQQLQFNESKRRQMSDRGGVIPSNSTPLATPKLIIPKIQTVQVEDITAETLGDTIDSPPSFGGFDKLSSPPPLVSPIPTIQVIGMNSKLDSPNLISVINSSSRPRTASPKPDEVKAETHRWNRTTSKSSSVNEGQSDSSDEENSLDKSKGKEEEPQRTKANVNSPSTHHKKSENLLSEPTRIQSSESDLSVESNIHTPGKVKDLFQDHRDSFSEENDKGQIHPGKHRNSKISSAATPGQQVPAFLAPVMDPTASDTPYRSEKNETTKDLFNSKVGSMIPGKSLKEFAMIPCPIGFKYQCKIVRNKSSMEKSMYPYYEMYLEDPENGDTFLLSARKTKKSKSSNYIVGCVKDEPKTREESVGKVRSNFLGTQFIIYDNGYNPFKNKIKSVNAESARKEHGLIIYETNILGMAGPRKMTFVIPKMLKSGEAAVVQPRHNNETITEKIKQGLTGDLLQLQNKQPQWNEESNAFVLNFNGRVTVPSVKNFQVVHSSDIDYIIMQFGRTQNNTFTVDIQYPLTPFQAFCIALTSFDAKLACE